MLFELYAIGYTFCCENHISHWLVQDPLLQASVLFFIYLISSLLSSTARTVLSFSSFSSSVVIPLAKIIVLPSSSLSSLVKRIAYKESLNVWLTESSSCGN